MTLGGGNLVLHVKNPFGRLKRRQVFYAKTALSLRGNSLTKCSSTEMHLQQCLHLPRNGLFGFQPCSVGDG